MIYSLFKISILSVFMVFAGCVSAEKPNVPTEAPYIVLSNNLDEPNGYGFCLDTYGPGQSELLQTALLECSDHPHQKFVYNDEDKTLRLEKDQSYCVAVVSTTVEAGPWFKRALDLATCSEVESDLKQWTVVSS